MANCEFLILKKKVYSNTKINYWHKIRQAVRLFVLFSVTTQFTFLFFIGSFLVIHPHAIGIATRRKKAPIACWQTWTSID